MHTAKTSRLISFFVPQATSKVRNFLLESIYQLKKERNNIQVHQQSTLMRFKFFFKFLHKFGKDAAEEVCRTYIDTLSKLYSAHFKSYMKALMGLRVRALLSPSL